MLLDSGYPLQPACNLGVLATTRTMCFVGYLQVNVKGFTIKPASMMVLVVNGMLQCPFVLASTA